MTQSPQIVLEDLGIPADLSRHQDHSAVRMSVWQTAWRLCTQSDPMLILPGCSYHGNRRSRMGRQTEDREAASVVCTREALCKQTMFSVRNSKSNHGIRRMVVKRVHDLHWQYIYKHASAQPFQAQICQFDTLIKYIMSRCQDSVYQRSCRPYSESLLCTVCKQNFVSWFSGKPLKLLPHMLDFKPKMRQNLISTGALPQTPLGKLTALLQTP